jgi:hypothetical protein
VAWRVGYRSITTLSYLICLILRHPITPATQNPVGGSGGVCICVVHTAGVRGHVARAGWNRGRMRVRSGVWSVSARWESVECGRAVCEWGVPWESVRMTRAEEEECEGTVECGVWARCERE